MVGDKDSENNSLARLKGDKDENLKLKGCIVLWSVIVKTVFGSFHKSHVHFP